MKYKFVVKNLNDKELLLNIRSYFANTNNTIHKARNELKVISFKDKKYVIKSFKKPTFLKALLYTFFRDSKAKKSFMNALKIASFTPKAVGFIEFYKNGLLYESYFVSEYFEYDFTIREPLLDKNFKNREEVFKAFARFTLKLHKKSIFHKDYSPGNILIKKRDNDYIFQIVDINRMQFLQLSIQKRAKNFSKLWADDEDLALIGEEYIKHSKDKKSFINSMIGYSQKHKKFKSFTKGLKNFFKKVDKK